MCEIRDKSDEDGEIKVNAPRSVSKSEVQARVEAVRQLGEPHHLVSPLEQRLFPCHEDIVLSGLSGGRWACRLHSSQMGQDA